MAASPVDDRTQTLAPRPGQTVEAAEPAEPASRRELELDERDDDPDRYEQVAEHARGGLGRVVRAVDRRLGRTVAVKELLRRDPANEARFLREAMITARLEHPGIVPVHEAGRWPNGDPYYVMKLVEGRTLKELITESPTLQKRLGLLAHVIAVADAVGYAHSEGVIHRDIKPSNVIVGGFGETIVVDWGLARDRKRDVPEPSEELLAAGSGVSTVSGKVVGTPAYMSPEQARGDEVDERADVYALGAVLYELLAGVPPHSDTTPQAVLDRVIAGPPRPLALVVPSAPGELATIVRKAMARDPAARYPNAAALAEDLRRFTTGKLVSAHSYTTWALVQKRLARHRGVVAVAVASLLVLGAVGVASVRRVIAERNIARSQRGLAEKALASAEKRGRELVLLQAETALPRDPTAALAWLKSYHASDDERAKVVDVVDEALALGVAHHVFRPGDWVLDAQFTHDGAALIAVVRDGAIRSYDIATGIDTLIGVAPSQPEALVLSPDGELAITGSTLGEVIAWPLRGGEPRPLAGRTGRMVKRLRLSADRRLLIERESSPPMVLALDGGKPRVLGSPVGLRFAIADDDWSRIAMMTAANEVAIVGPGGVARPLIRTDRPIEFLAISPCGDTVVIHDGTTIWALPFAGGERRELARYDEELRRVVWSHDGTTIALGGTRHEILLVTLATGEITELRGHTDAIYTLELSRDGSRLLSASDDGTARVWLIANQTALVLRGHDDDVFRARFSADERRVATASLDGSTRLWVIDRPADTMYVEGEPIEDMWLEGGRALVRTATAVARWDLGGGSRDLLFSSTGDSHELGYSVASRDGAHVVIAHADGTLELRTAGGATRVLAGHLGLVTRSEFSRDGKLLYSAARDGSLRRWDVATGAGEVVYQSTTPIRGFALARDGRIALQTGDLALMVSPDGTTRPLGSGESWCVQLAEFVPVTDRLVIHRCDKSLAIVEAGGTIELATGGYAAGRIAVSPDGRMFASAISDRTIRLWDAVTGRVIDTLRGHSDLVMDVAFSPDGGKLASASYDRTVRLWDLRSRQHRVLRGHTASVDRVAWRDPEHLVTGSNDGTIRLWDAPSLELPSASEIADRLTAATSAQIESDRPATGPRPVRGS